MSKILQGYYTVLVLCLFFARYSAVAKNTTAVIAQFQQHRALLTTIEREYKDMSKFVADDFTISLKYNLTSEKYRANTQHKGKWAELEPNTATYMLKLMVMAGISQNLFSIPNELFTQADAHKKTRQATKIKLNMNMLRAINVR